MLLDDLIFELEGEITPQPFLIASRLKNIKAEIVKLEAKCLTWKHNSTGGPLLP